MRLFEVCIGERGSASMNWPKGKYNGQRIDGFKVSVTVHLLYWAWRPLCRWSFGEPYLIWLCFTLRAKASYEGIP